MRYSRIELNWIEVIYLQIKKLEWNGLIVIHGDKKFHLSKWYKPKSNQMVDKPCNADQTINASKEMLLKKISFRWIMRVHEQLDFYFWPIEKQPEVFCKKSCS